MSKPRYTPPEGYYFDDPADKLDPVDPAKAEQDRVDQKASHVLTRVGEWITRGRGGLTNRFFRFDIVLSCVTPQFLPTNRPSAAWVAREHGRSRQRARDLREEFSDYIDIKFRGQRFGNQRRGRGRQGKQGPPPGPIAGA